jgi:hypothetical protein
MAVFWVEKWNSLSGRSVAVSSSVWSVVWTGSHAPVTQRVDVRSDCRKRFLRACFCICYLFGRRTFAIQCATEMCPLLFVFATKPLAFQPVLFGDAFSPTAQAIEQSEQTGSEAGSMLARKRCQRELVTLI